MTFGLLAIGGLLLASQAMACALVIRQRRRSWPFAVLALLAVEGTLAVYMVAGLYAESRWALVQSLWRKSSPSSVRPEFPPLPSGDPALVRLATASDGIAEPDWTSPQAFQAWQTGLRKRIQYSLLGEPGTDEGTFTETGVEAVDEGIKRHALTLVAWDGTALPALLFVPPGSNHAPGVLVLPGHVDDDSESGLAQTAGLVASYQHGAALQLAKRGFVTLTFEFRGFGLLGPPKFPDHLAVAHNAILAGSSYKAMAFHDVKTAMHVLLSRPEVDSSRVGVTGTSFGGEMALLYSAMDTRVSATAINSFALPEGPFPAAIEMSRALQPHFCHTLPGENRVLRQQDWVSLLAPRPVRFVYGESENPGNFESKFTAYKKLGFKHHDFVVVRGGGHEFFIDQTAEFFRRQFGGAHTERYLEPYEHATAH